MWAYTKKGLEEGHEEREGLFSWRNTQSPHDWNHLFAGKFETDRMKLRVKEVPSHLNFRDMVGGKSSNQLWNNLDFR